MIQKCFFFVTLSLMFMASCVPPRQYAELENRNDTCRQEKEMLKTENEKFSVENTELKAKLEKLHKEIKELEKDSLARKEALVKMEIEYNNLLEKYNRLQEAQNDLIKGSERSTKRLLDQLEKTMEQNQKKEDKLRELEVAIEKKKHNLDKLQKQMEEQKARLIEMEKILSRKDSLMNALKNKVSKALTGFEGQGLSIKRKNGKVYVSLEEKLLFSSGSYDLQPNGIKALKKLAGVLEKNPDIQVTIEGHTDDVPYIPDEEIKDNWDLSVKRATAVIRVILKNSEIDPKRLTAAGRGQHLPLDPGDSKQARAKNRRTEIILSPNLDQLFNILNN